MDKLYCLIGPSGSGKSTIEREIEKRGLKRIISYTTRKPRQGEIDGVDYFFRDDFNYERLAFRPNVFEHVEFDGNHYWTMLEQFLQPGNLIIVVEPHGYEFIRENLKEKEVIGIYLYTDPLIRWSRMMGRELPLLRTFEERKALNLKVSKRVDHDEQSDKFKLIKPCYIVNNNGTLEETLELIEGIIHDR